MFINRLAIMTGLLGVNANLLKKPVYGRILLAPSIVGFQNKAIGGHPDAPERPGVGPRKEGNSGFFLL